MAEEYKNVPEHETPKITTTEETSAATGEVKDRGLFDFLGKKEEVKPQETTTPLASEVEHKAQITEPEHKPTLIEQLHQKHEEEEENKPSLLHKLHRSNSSSSSSSEEEGEDGVKRKKEKKKKTVEGDEKKGVMEKIKEKLPGHSEKPEDSQVVNTEAAVPVQTEETAVHPEEKKGILEKIKEKLPGYHAKSTGEEEEKKEKESHA